MLQQLLIRHLTPSVSENDLRHALSGYGNVVSLKMHQNGTTATVRMGMDEATKAANAGQLNVNGATLSVEVDSRYTPGAGPTGGRGGFGRGGYPSHGGNYPPPQHSGYPPQHGGYNQQGGYPPQGGYPQQGGYPPPQPMYPQPARVQIRVENCLYPVTTDVLSQALAMVAPAQRVEAYPSPNQTVTGIADFADYATADNVVRALNGKSIYPDCCRVLLNHAAPPPPQQPQYPPPMGGRGGYGMDARGGMGMRGRGMGGMGGPMMGRGGAAPYENPMQYQDPVVIVTNVPEDCPLKNLWTLMEVYGNVRTLRRQYSARTSVIAAMYSHNDLRAMLSNINGCPFYGSTLGIKSFAGFNVKGSHHTEWNAGLATDPNTLAYDFSSSHHRGRPSDKLTNVRKGRPAKHLFVTNLSDKISDDVCKSLFTSKGYTLLDYERKSDTIAIIDLESIEVAVKALCDTHATLIEERHVKVSFSLWPPHSVPPGVNAEKAAEGETDDATASPNGAIEGANGVSSSHDGTTEGLAPIEVSMDQA